MSLAFLPVALSEEAVFAETGISCDFCSPEPPRGRLVKGPRLTICEQCVADCVAALTSAPVADRLATDAVAPL